MRKGLFYLGFLAVVIFLNLPTLQAEQENKSIAFVILANLRSENDNKLWQRCYSSIRQFYPTEKIMIIDDNSKVGLTNLPTDVTYIKSEFPGAGELLPYYYFLQYQWTQKMIFLHDSMLLCRSFHSHELDNPIKFHWFFETHDCDDNHAINYLLSHLNYSEELIHDNMHGKANWWGCFGVATIIDLEVLKAIEAKYAFTSTLTAVINNRDHRMALERVFGIIMFRDQWVNPSNCSNFGSIFHQPYVGQIDIEDSQIEYAKAHYHGAIIKTWHNR